MCSRSCSFYESDDDDESFYDFREMYRRYETVCVKFTNKTGRYIYISGWDEGEEVFPRSLSPGRSLEVTTFVDYPWKFYDAFTNERYVVNNQKCFKLLTGLPPKISMQFNITPGVRTLRKMALVTLGSYIKKEDDVDTLRLPPALIGEVKSAVKYLNEKWLVQWEGEDYVNNKDWSKCEAVIWKLLYLTGALLLADLLGWI